MPSCPIEQGIAGVTLRANVRQQSPCDVPLAYEAVNTSSCVDQALPEAVKRADRAASLWIWDASERSVETNWRWFLLDKSSKRPRPQRVHFMEFAEEGLSLTLYLSTLKST